MQCACHAASDFGEGLSESEHTGYGRNAYLRQCGRFYYHNQKRCPSGHAGRRGDFKTNQFLRMKEKVEIMKFLYDIIQEISKGISYY